MKLPRAYSLPKSSSSPHCDCLSDGAIAGIVVGSVAGLALLCWILKCTLFSTRKSRLTAFTTTTYKLPYASRRQSQSHTRKETYYVSEPDGRQGIEVEAHQAGITVKRDQDIQKSASEATPVNIQEETGRQEEMASADAYQPLAPQKLSRYRSVRAPQDGLPGGAGGAGGGAAAGGGGGDQSASISRSMSRYRKKPARVPPPPLPLPPDSQQQQHRNSHYDYDYDQDALPSSSSRRVSMPQAAPVVSPLQPSARPSLDRSSTNRHSYANTPQYDRQFFDGRESYETHPSSPSAAAAPYFVVEPGMGPNTFDPRQEEAAAAAAQATKKSRGKLFKEKGGGLLGRFKGEDRSHKEKKKKKQTAEVNTSGAGVDAPVSAVNAGERKVRVTCNESSVSLPVTPSTQAQDLIHAAADCLSEGIVPDAAIIVESFQQLNLERPLRRYEHVRDVLNSWNTDTQNTLKIIADPDPNILPALLAKSAPRRQPPDVSFNLYHRQRTGKWDRRWVTLRTDGVVTVSKKQGSADSTNVCHVSDFDIYTPTRKEYKRLKPPKPLCFAIKSQQKSAMFLTTENYVHYFCTKHEDVGGAWHNAVQEWRSWYLVNVMGEGTRKKAAPDAEQTIAETPYHDGDEAAYDAPTGKKSRPSSFSAAPLVQHAANKEAVVSTTKQKVRGRSKSISKKKTAAADDPLDEEQPFAASGLLGRTYTQRHKAMLEREKEHAPADDGPFISTGLLSNIRPGAPTSPVSNHFPDHHQPVYPQQQQQPHHYGTNRSNTMTVDPRPATTSSSQHRSKSTRHPPKPLVDLTPTYKEPPQHARKGRGVAPIQGLPLVESATGPELHPNAIVVPPSTTWRKPGRTGTATSDPSYARDTYPSSRHRSNTGGASRQHQHQHQQHQHQHQQHQHQQHQHQHQQHQQGGGPLLDMNAGYPGHVPGSFPFVPTGLVAQAGMSQGASSKGRGVATGDRARSGKPLLDMSNVPVSEIRRERDDESG
ncbi:hypothetical protein McanMca71_000984 [Microsporum canis]